MDLSDLRLHELKGNRKNIWSVSVIEAWPLPNKSANIAISTATKETEALDMSDFAERLKLLRESRQISQARLAELLEIDPRSYNRWERGGNIPHLDTIIKIADILQVTLDELVGRKRTQHGYQNQESRITCTLSAS